MRIPGLVLVVLSTTAVVVRAQITDSEPGAVAGIPANYTEARTGSYTLPDPLIMQDGRPVSSAAMWRGERRGEILRLFESQVYGRRANDSIDWSV